MPPDIDNNSDNEEDEIVCNDNDKEFPTMSDNDDDLSKPAQLHNALKEIAKDIPSDEDSWCKDVPAPALTKEDGCQFLLERSDDEEDCQTNTPSKQLPQKECNRISKKERKRTPKKAPKHVPNKESKSKRLKISVSKRSLAGVPHQVLPS